jgi:hypothetical protein
VTLLNPFNVISCSASVDLFYYRCLSYLKKKFESDKMLARGKMERTLLDFNFYVP